MVSCSASHEKNHHRFQSAVGEGDPLRRRFESHRRVNFDELLAFYPGQPLLMMAYLPGKMNLPAHFGAIVRAKLISSDW